MPPVMAGSVVSPKTGVSDPILSRSWSSSSNQLAYDLNEVTGYVLVHPRAFDSLPRVDAAFDLGCDIRRLTPSETLFVTHVF